MGSSTPSPDMDERINEGLKGLDPYLGDPYEADSDGEMDEEAMRAAEKMWMGGRSNIDYSDVVRTDDKDAFRRCLLGYVPLVFGFKGYLYPSRFSVVCRYAAFDIAKGLLHGEFRWKVNVNSRFKDGSYSLHNAAINFKYDFLELLLTHGARTDVRTQGPEIVDGLLPLNAAVEETCLHKYLECWTKKDSVFKLILLLSLPEMKIFLDCISLIARYTDHIFDELWNYVEQQKLLQMAVLFVAAHQKIKATTLQGEDGKGINAMEALRRRIDDAIVFLCQESVDIPNKDKNGKDKNGLSVKKCNTKMKAMASARQVCVLMEKIGDSLDEFRVTVHSEISHKEVIEYLRSLVAREGFLLQQKDIDFGNLIWYRYPGDVEGEKLLGQLGKSATKPPQPKAYSVDLKVLENWRIRRFIPTWNSVLSCKSFIEQPIYGDNGFIIGLEGTNREWEKMEKRKVRRAVQPRYKIESGMKGSMIPMTNYQSRTQYSTVASFILRAIRRV